MLTNTLDAESQVLLEALQNADFLSFGSDVYILVPNCSDIKRLASLLMALARKMDMVPIRRRKDLVVSDGVCFWFRSSHGPLPPDTDPVFVITPQESHP